MQERRDGGERWARARLLADDISFSPQRTTVGGGCWCRAGARVPARRYRCSQSPGRTFGSERGKGCHPENTEVEKNKGEGFSFPEGGANSLKLKAPFSKEYQTVKIAFFTSSMML